MTDCSDCTILLLDDEPLILMDLEFAVEDKGCAALCSSTVQQAIDLLEQTETIHVAILDVTLQDGETCVPVARALEQRGIPFVLHSGDLDRQDETVRDLDAELIAKPSSADSVIRRALDFSERTRA
ncbi:response regulator [Altericroceibacterium endophyticum]|uniref:Response regulator n=1 Tax=Altericroceibacterium endophyticum TaxID=1808508 RepID=A0A6I4T9Y3_9SPHN|nr:response regulator [Altericroceibacterium endophyticum]MXO66971.1 response regulator [Altericroceibacterium endophyticum]